MRQKHWYQLLPKVVAQAIAVDVHPSEQFCVRSPFCKPPANIVSCQAAALSEQIALIAVYHDGIATPNVLTLDRCDSYFDDRLEEKNGYVIIVWLRIVLKV